MKFRKAVEKDMGELLILFKELLIIHGKEEPNIFKNEVEDYILKDYINNAFSNENYNFYVAEDEKIIGAIEVINIVEENNKLKNRRYALIDKLVVDKNYRAGGVGDGLIEYAEKELKSMGINEIELYVWEFNKEALKLYEKKGYRTICKRMSKSI